MRQAGQDAANAVAELLDIFEEIFGINYALDKMDMVAVPLFKWEGMENWGLSIFRRKTFKAATLL